MLRELMSEETFQQLAVARSVIETVATLTYLLEDDGSGERYDQYVKNSLIAEREVLRDIASNADQGDELVRRIEERMQRSIDRTAQAAGISDVSTLPGRGRIGFPSAETRVRALGFGAYTAYRMGSVEVHGDWTDIYRNHLNFDGVDFTPNPRDMHIRPQPVLLVAMLPIVVVDNHIGQIVDQSGAAEFLQPQLQDLRQRLLRLNDLHEQFLQRS
jgi:hypothetical protein